MPSSCLWKCNFLAFCSSPPFRHANFTRYRSIWCPLVSHPVYRCKFLGGTVVSSSTSYANLIKKFDCDQLSWLVEPKERRFMGSSHGPTWGCIEKAKSLSFSFIKSFYTQVLPASSQTGARATVRRISLRKNTNTRKQKPKNRWYSFVIWWW